MKKTLFAMALLASTSVFAETVTVTVYDGGESGTEKRVVTYVVRPHKDVAAIYAPCGETTTPCVNPNAGLSGWVGQLLVHLNDAAAKAGAKPPVEDNNFIN